MRKLAILILILFLMTSPPLAQAEDQQPLIGTPIVRDDGVILLGGREISLWGIDMLAGDQQCWQDDKAWACGAQAVADLRKLISDMEVVKCAIQPPSSAVAVTAQCLNGNSDVDSDLARKMVLLGWAFDRADVSQSTYAYDQDTARKNRQGVWTSRFQTPVDWRNHIQRFVVYDMVADPNPPQPVVLNNYILLDGRNGPADQSPSRPDGQPKAAPSDHALNATATPDSPTYYQQRLDSTNAYISNMQNRARQTIP